MSLLAQVIRHRVQPQLPGNIPRHIRIEVEPDVDETAEDVLRRVAISRVFDIEGLWEVLSEISRDSYSSEQAEDVKESVKKMADRNEPTPLRTEDGVQMHAETGDEELDNEAEVEKQAEIGDSEAEDDEELDLDLEAEMVDRLTENQTTVSRTQEVSHDPTAKSTEKGGTDIIIIDNMTTPINDLFSLREKSAGMSHLPPLLLLIFHSQQLPN